VRAATVKSAATMSGTCECRGRCRKCNGQTGSAYRSKFCHDYLS